MKYYCSSPESGVKLSEIANHDSINSYLLSYALEAKKQWRKYYDIGQDIIIDSGAFSVWNSGKTINIEDYKNFCLTLPEDVPAINLDVIPQNGNNQREHIKKCCEQSFQNYLYLKKYKWNILPVYHYKDEWEYFERYKNETDHVALSADNDTALSIKDSFFLMVFREIKNTMKIHALGYTSLQGLKKFPFYSIDSISWKNPCLTGDYFEFCSIRKEIIKSHISQIAKNLGIAYNPEASLTKELMTEAVKINLKSLKQIMEYLTEYHRTKDFSYLDAQISMF